MATPKAVWDAFTTRAFAEICKDETIAGNRPSGWLSTTGYNNLEARFFERTGKKFTRKQFKNRWDLMKKDYVLWVELNNKTTGLGRCPIRKTVDASDEWWNIEIGVNKEFAKFRDGPPANLECLEVIFNKAFVTDDTTTILGMVLGRESSPVLLEGSGSSTDAAGEELSGSGSKRKKISKAKGKKTSKYFQEYKKAARAISSQCTPSIQSTGSSVPSIKEVIQLMIDCGAVQGTPLFFTACNLALKPEIRELFLAIPSNEGRFDYLERSHAHGL